ncbi:MAG: TolC family protein [Kiritimatiellaeota bacterium]|nr:TolC family protein [Kiritimatiellota bacterium]
MKKNILPPVVLAITLFLGGCFSYKPVPDAVLNSNYTKQKDKAHLALPKNCETLLLDQAKQIALDNNPNYIATRYSMVAASARFYQTLAGYLPTITANYDITNYYYTPESQGGRGRDRGGHRWAQKTGTINGRWLIFNGLIRTMDMLAAKHSELQAEALNRDARRLLIESVAVTYNNVLLAKENIRIAKADEIFNEQLYNDTKLKYEAGAVPLTDMLNFEIRVNTAKNAVISEELNFFTARSVLAELMGFTNGIIPGKVFPELKPTEEQFAIDIGVYLDTALQNRPDLKAYREAVKVSRYDVYAKWGAFSPTLNFTTSWGYQRNDDGYSGSYQYRPRTQDRSFNYGFEAEWVLFSGGSRIAALREAQANLAVGKQNLVEKWISVISEVRQTFEERMSKAMQVKIYKRNLALVNKNRDLVEESYKAGNTSITRLNEAQRDLVDADSSYTRSVIDLANAKAKLRAAIGVHQD